MGLIWNVLDIVIAIPLLRTAPGNQLPVYGELGIGNSLCPIGGSTSNLAHTKDKLMLRCDGPGLKIELGPGITEEKT